MEIFSQGVLSTPKLQRLQTAEVDDEGSWEGSLNTTIQKLFKDMIGFHDFEHLTTSEFPHLKEVWHDQFPVQVLCNLKSLVMDDCANISSPISGNLLLHLNSLEKLHVRNGDSLEEVFNLEELNADGDLKVLSQLSEFFLVDLPRLEHIWKKNHSEVLNFRNLKSIKVHYCSNLRYIFTPSVVLGLMQLQELEIKNCAIMEEIITMEGENDAAAFEKTTFLQLSCLIVKSLPNLTSFYSGSNTLECPSLTTINISDCPKMETFVFTHLKDNCTRITPLLSEKVELPTLASLKLSSIASQTIWHNQLQAHSACFHNLTKLTIYGCHNLKCLCPFSVAESLNHLEVIDIRNCKLTEGVVMAQDERKTSILFPKLNKLNLRDLPELIRFCTFNGNSIELPSLSALLIHNCPKMQTFASNSLPGIEEPEEVNTETEENLHSFFDEKVVLPTLASINLSSIRIQTIWHNQLQPMSPCFQNLKEIIMDGCDTVKYGLPSSMVESLVQLQVLEISNCKLMEVVTITAGERINNTLFTKLHRLHLKHLPELTTFCNFAGKLIELTSLAQLWLENCPKMHAFVSNSPHADMPAANEEQMNSERNLHSHIQPFFDEKVRILDLKFLHIKKMDNMRKIWCHQHIIMDSFSKIDFFQVYDCHKLLNIFPSNMLGRLQKLEKLFIQRCNSLELIFEELNTTGRDVETVPRVLVFPQLTWLRLSDLPSLRSFYLGLYISEWPKLNKLSMWRCNKVEILTSEHSSFEKSHGGSQPENSIQEQLFIVDKVAFPKIEHLALEWNWIVKEILHRNFSKYSCNIKVVELIRASKQSGICPCCFLCTLTNLERLDVYHGFFEEIFACEELDCKKKHADTPSKLSQLRLANLADSLHQCEEDSLLCKVFRNLTSLEVLKCHTLKNLVPSFVSFQNLKKLEVSRCDGLVNLMEVSVAKNLGQLTRLKINECKMIEEIIMHGVDEVENRMIFYQLEYLELHSLPKLTSFCSGNCNIEFPSLQQIVMRQCPTMEIFSQGVLSTPKLQRLQTAEVYDEGSWAGSLNTTIQKLFKDMVGFRCIENFTISDFPHLKEVWREKILVRNLKSLVMDDKCCSLRYIFTSSVALSLVQLQKLQIKNCVILEVIEVIEEETVTNNLFPNLYELKLINLPELESFCNFAGNAIELPSLTHLLIENCPNIQTFVSNFTGEDMSTTKDKRLTDIQPLFDEKIRLSNLKLLRLDKMDKLREIWHHQLSLNSFSKLDSLGLYNCHNVLNVFPSNMFGRLQKLKWTVIKNCSSLYEIFELQASSCGKTQAITAAQLEKLVLHDLPKLKHIWDVDSQGLLTCQNLISIEVIDCGSLKSVFPASVGRNLLRLEQLWIENCCMVEEIFAKEEQVDEAVPRFPRLTFLRLAELPRLQSFYPRVHISEWPVLKNLHVWKCDRIEIFVSNVLRFQVNQGESQQEKPMEQPLLLLDKVPFNNLESLTLDWKWIEKESLHEKLPMYSCKLKVLTFVGFHNEANICVSCFLHKLPDLERLQARQGFFKEIFSFKGFGCEEKHVEAPSKLSILWLFDVFDTLHLWEENSLSGKVFQNLRILEVIKCGNLKCLVPSSASFKNLKTLKVSKCNGLLNLVAAPTAKSMMQLTKLSVSECERIEEIIIHEGDEVEDIIIFKKLSCLELQCLPSLTSFYSGNYITEFPSLEQLVVRECPNMKTFSRGVLRAPRLYGLQITETAEGKGYWKGNLNTTVEHLFTENGQSSKED